MMGEGLVLGVLAFIAGVLLVVGLIQAFQPPPRRRVRPGRIRDRAREIERFAAPIEEAPAPHAEPALSEPIPASARPVPEPAAAPPVLDFERLSLKECFALYRAKQYRNLISVAEPALQRASVEVVSAGPARELAVLWGLVGLAKQALNDTAGTLAAFEAAVHAAPEADRPTYERYLTALTSRAADQPQARAEVTGHAAEEEIIGPLRRAVLWLACSHLAHLLIQRMEFEGARRLIWQALGDEELPADPREAFKELLSTAYGREIEQLTSHALRMLEGEESVRSLEDERQRDVLIALQRAEGLLSTLPEGSVVPGRFAEVLHRLWRGYTTLGLRQVKAGEFENALEPLFHALWIGRPDPESQQETRVALIRALEAVVERRSGLIDQLLKAGEREAAVAEGEWLLSLAHQAMETGLSNEEIAPALTKTRRALERVRQG